MLRHWQLPLLQTIRPQQSVDVVHEPPDSVQHRLEVGEGRHEEDVQHCVACEHELPVATHEPPVQTPATQVCPAEHALPHDPQLSGSVWRSASPSQGPSTHAPEALQVRSRLPQVPHTTNVVSPGVHEVQGPSTYAQESLQVRVRDCPEGQPVLVDVVEPGTHSPSPVHDPEGCHTHSVVQRAVCVPQLPQGTELVVPGSQTPSPLHASYSHCPEAAQKRVCVPQRPHDTVSSSPGVSQESSLHVPPSPGSQASLQSASRV